MSALQQLLWLVSCLLVKAMKMYYQFFASPVCSCMKIAPHHAEDPARENCEEEMWQEDTGCGLTSRSGQVRWTECASQVPGKGHSTQLHLTSSRSVAQLTTSANIYKRSGKSTSLRILRTLIYFCASNFESAAWIRRKHCTWEEWENVRSTEPRYISKASQLPLPRCWIPTL